MKVGKIFLAAILAWILISPADGAMAADKLVIMTAGLSIRHTPLYYGQEKGFFKDEGLELHM